MWICTCAGETRKNTCEDLELRVLFSASPLRYHCATPCEATVLARLQHAEGKIALNSSSTFASVCTGPSKGRSVPDRANYAEVRTGCIRVKDASAPTRCFGKRVTPLYSATGCPDAGSYRRYGRSRALTNHNVGIIPGSKQNQRKKASSTFHPTTRSGHHAMKGVQYSVGNSRENRH